MQEELIQLKWNKVWELIPIHNFANIIGTKWIYKNKSDKNENVIRNKARLVAQVYNQQKEFILMKPLPVLPV